MRALREAQQAASSTSEVRQELAELREELEQVRADAAAETEALSSELARRVNVSGYNSMYLHAEQDRAPYFRAFLVNIILNAHIADSVRFFAEIEFEDAREVGEGEEWGAIEVEAAFMELSILRYLGLRAGVLIVPFGYYNLFHEGWRYPFITRPLMNDKLFPSMYADVGVSLFGTPVRTDRFQLSYEIAAVNGLTANLATSLSGEDLPVGLRDARPLDNDDNAWKSFVGRLRFTIGEHAELGLSGYWGPYLDSGTDAITMVGVDLLLQWTNLFAWLEGIYIDIGGPDRVALIDDDEDPETPAVEAAYARSMAGASLTLEGRYWPRFLRDTFFRALESPNLFLGLRLELAAQEFESWREELHLSVSAGFRPVIRSAIRLEFTKSWGFGDGELDLGDRWTVNLSFSLGY